MEIPAGFGEIELLRFRFAGVPATFKERALDPPRLERVSQSDAGGTGSDDADLRVQGEALGGGSGIQFHVSAG